MKVWWEEREEVERETYLDLTEEQFAIIAGDPDVDIVEHTERGGHGRQRVVRRMRRIA